MSPQAHFDAEQVGGWLREGPLAEGLLETLGDVLGWCGVVTSVGLEATRRRDKKQILTLAVRRAFAPLAERRDSRSSGLSRKVPELLVAMAERALLLQDDWLGPRTLEGWVELLPDEDRLGPDVDWMRAHLTAATKSIRARDVERAAARFSAGGASLDGALARRGAAAAGRRRAFRAAATLSRTFGHGQREVRVDSRFERRLGRRAARGRGVRFGLARIAQARRGRTGVLDRLGVGGFGRREPEFRHRLDASVVAMGLCVLGGRDLPPALVEPLLDEACALALQQHNELPRPRIALGSPIAGMDSNTLWWLCLIALGETREPSGERPITDSCRGPSGSLRRSCVNCLTACTRSCDSCGDRCRAGSWGHSR